MQKTLYQRILFQFPAVAGQTSYTVPANIIDTNLSNVFCAGLVVSFFNIYQSNTVVGDLLNRVDLMPFTGNNILPLQSQFANPLGNDNSLFKISKEMGVDFDNLKIVSQGVGDWVTKSNTELYDLVLPVAPTAEDLFVLVSAVIYQLPNKITYKFK